MDRIGIYGDDVCGGRGGEVGVSDGRSELGLGDRRRQKPGPTDSKPRPRIAALARAPGEQKNNNPRRPSLCLLLSQKDTML